MIDRRILLLAAAMPLVQGCFFFDFFDDDEPYVDSPDAIPPTYNDGTLIVSEGAFQRGNMGDIRDYDGTAVASQASYSGSYSSVRLDSLGDNWWVMSYLSVSGIDILTAEPGTYRSDEVGSSGLYLSVTGCSGESYGNYTFDSGSTDATVTITDNGDGTRHLVFDASFENYTTGEMQVGSGEFDYQQGSTVAPPPYEDPGYVQQAIVASDATQDGSMGDIVSYVGAARTSEGYYYGNSSSIRLDSEGSGWWVMSYLSVNNIDLVNAPAGTYQTTSATYDGTEPQVNVTGCSGPSYGDYTVDSGSTDATLILTDNADGSRTVDVTATYNFYGTTAPQTAHSTFAFRVQ